jgi:hypothetical protein
VVATFRSGFADVALRTIESITPDAGSYRDTPSSDRPARSDASWIGEATMLG